ncbi:MAG TPA: cysteine--tRNA ligase [Prolixibacteraceae bacterium]|nr:cysteine--tRNA ligase [Prolixibacteraceae bacterium]
MIQEIQIYNTLTRKKEVFEPLVPGKVGLYVCGPTVYGPPHLGHARSAITFDLIFRFLKQIGYKVRYVRNITDVGHLVADSDDGEDKIEVQAKLDELEPMEVVQKYTNLFHQAMEMLNVQPPSIEPRASGHIIEQIEEVKKILNSGYAYESNGSVYFDVEKFASENEYGKLSGRKIEDQISYTRTLDGQDEKRSALDFALWKKASPEHLMRWPSPWSEGFPGWHLECTAMSCKYLGETFDIHGGGMDLTFPHHEAEMAQAQAAHGKQAVRYWMHNNMITLNGQKMGKSLGNAISLEELFSGNHPLLEKAYSPMTIRFFMFQAHYRSTLDFSNEALQASEKGLERLMKATARIESLPVSENSSVNIAELSANCFTAMADDMNSPIAIAYLFEGVKIINSVADGNSSITLEDRIQLNSLFHSFVFDILGLKSEDQAGSGSSVVLNEVVALLMKLRAEAKASKDWATSDKIRNELSAIGFDIKDGKEGVSWELKK